MPVVDRNKERKGKRVLYSKNFILKIIYNARLRVKNRLRATESFIFCGAEIDFPLPICYDVF